ncbi:unnamed protein product [Allacma fusca]|uniref:Uncharacterized protein n=1 Tax=Allacma fusca TaxID=39272 RepID=A0A8J2JQL8_9HEXA|nr:unnamed protein product [Allacma fusca]
MNPEELGDNDIDDIMWRGATFCITQKAALMEGKAAPLGARQWSTQMHVDLWEVAEVTRVPGGAWQYLRSKVLYIRDQAELECGRRED